MAVITNQDFFDAIRGKYNNDPNKVTDADAKSELEAIKAELQAIKQRLDGVFNTQLTGRNVEVVAFFNALAIADTNLKISPKVSLAKYKKVFFIAVSSLNQPVTVSPRLDTPGTSYMWDGATWKGYSTSSGRSVQIPASSSSLFMLNTFFNEFNNQPIYLMDWLARCTTAPTSGSLTIAAWGVPN